MRIATFAVMPMLFVAGCSDGDSLVAPADRTERTQVSKAKTLPPAAAGRTATSTPVPAKFEPRSLRVAPNEETIAIHPLLRSAPLPPGFQIGRTVSRFTETTRGEIIPIGNDSGTSHMTILIEHRDLSDVDYRRTAVKAYVNSSAKELYEAGFTRFLDKQLPDLNRETMLTPVSARVRAANADGEEIWIHLEAFFTDKGFKVGIVAQDLETLNDLAAWAKTVRPVR